ncbi:hypothetical protein KGD82_26585 [Nocardiopsis eucommiae]|uniref:Radical SAM protein n=1 Tax=Nocardiopsis eucommiae TaxID=2831970 RepID=A0A975LDZ9_9ACTN|nr:hypothetical protein KGD82_26585 [Nocardiopsis eucommiae]
MILQPTTLCNLNCSYCYLPVHERICQGGQGRNAKQELVRALGEKMGVRPMTTLTGLEASERAADLIDRLQPTTPVGPFDNRDTWDNVGGGPWDNRSTRDNWKK